eukprot:gene18532-24251_t
MDSAKLAPTLQINKTSIQNFLNSGFDINRYPFGYVLAAVLNDNRIDYQKDFCDREILLAFRQLYDAAIANDLSTNELNVILDALSVEHRQLVIIDQIKNVDVNRSLLLLESNQAVLNVIKENVRQTLLSLFTSKDKQGYALRSGLSAVAETISVVIENGITPVADGLSNAIAFFILVGSEVRSFANGEIEIDELAENIGEHFFGCSAGFGGTLYGALAAKALLGSACPGLILLEGILGILFGFGFDFGARVTYRSLVTKIKEFFNVSIDNRVEKRAKFRLASAIAKKEFKIDISKDNFKEAQRKYRKFLLEYYPDRRPKDAPESLEFWNERAARMISNWNLIRNYYEIIGDETLLGTENEPKQPEAFFKIYIMKVYDVANEKWKTVRTWFDETPNYPAGYNDQNVIVTEGYFYI